MNEGSYHLADSTEAYIALPSVDAYQLGTADFTVEAWVKTYRGGPVLGIMASESSSGFYLLLNPGSIEIATSDAVSFAGGTASNVSICDGIWHHVAAVRYGDSFVIYLDHVSVQISESTNGDPPLNINSSDRLTLGAVDSSSISNQHYDGQLSEVRLWNVARTAEQTQIYSRSRLDANGLDNSLIGYWPAIFGTTVDFSATRNQGTVHGQLVGSGEVPPLLGPNVETLFYIYYGIYELQIEASSGTWSPAGQLALTSRGFVVWNNSTILDDAYFDATHLKWSSPYDNNTFSGDLVFKIDSSNPTYWPTTKSGELCEGSMQQGSAPVIIRGAMMPDRVSCGIVLNVGC